MRSVVNSDGTSEEVMDRRNLVNLEPGRPKSG